MKTEPHHHDDYTPRQVEAARRVLVDLGQVLASFEECIVVAGGSVPDLLLKGAGESHVGTVDVDIVLDAARLDEGRYAEMLKLLLNTRRYRKGTKPFQLVIEVNLKDGKKPVPVEVEFLAPKDVKLKRNRPKLLQGFRVLKADACGVALHNPQQLTLPGKNVAGARNTVRLRVASLADFLVMKAHAIAGRDKPKDSYDLCYCLEYSPGGMGPLAADWGKRRDEKDVANAVEILREKFTAVDAFGPQQLVEFHRSPEAEARAMQSRRAYELVQGFLSLLEQT